MKYIKFSLCIFTLALFLLFSFSVSADTADDESYMSKISKNVFTAPKNENGEICVIVYRSTITEEQYEEYFFNKYGFHGYECEKNQEYIEIVGAQLGEVQYNKYKDNSDNPEALWEYFSKTFKNYDSIKRRITSEATTAQNELFVEKCGLDKSKITYNGSFTGTFCLIAAPEKIIELAKEESVQRISWFENAVQDPHGAEVGENGGASEGGSANTETEKTADAETTGAPESWTVGALSETPEGKAVPLAAEGETKPLESETNGTQTENTDKSGFPWVVIAVICGVIACGVVLGIVFSKKKTDGKSE